MITRDQAKANSEAFYSKELKKLCDDIYYCIEISSKLGNRELRDIKISKPFYSDVTQTLSQSKFQITSIPKFDKEDPDSTIYSLTISWK